MTITFKTNSDGVTGAIQVNGVDKVTVGSTGIQMGVFITSYADDVAAAAGVPIGGFYHTTGTVKVRLT